MCLLTLNHCYFSCLYFQRLCYCSLTVYHFRPYDDFSAKCCYCCYYYCSPISGSTHSQCCQQSMVDSHYLEMVQWYWWMYYFLANSAIDAKLWNACWELTSIQKLVFAAAAMALGVSKHLVQSHLTGETGKKTKRKSSSNNVHFEKN